MVDSRPTEQSPPSTIAFTRASIAREAIRKVVGLGSPDTFAEGAAIGRPVSSSSRLATGWEGMRMPTVSWPAVTVSGMAADFFTTRVRGPGE